MVTAGHLHHARVGARRTGAAHQVSAAQRVGRTVPVTVHENDLPVHELAHRIPGRTPRRQTHHAAHQVVPGHGERGAPAHRMTDQHHPYRTRELFQLVERPQRVHRRVGPRAVPPPVPVADPPHEDVAALGGAQHRPRERQHPNGGQIHPGRWLHALGASAVQQQYGGTGSRGRSVEHEGGRERSTGIADGHVVPDLSSVIRGGWGPIHHRRYSAPGPSRMPRPAYRFREPEQDATSRNRPECTGPVSARKRRWCGAGPRTVTAPPPLSPVASSRAQDRRAVPSDPAAASFVPRGPGTAGDASAFSAATAAARSRGPHVSLVVATPISPTSPMTT